MNMKLKLEIIEKFGSQADFALAANLDEPYVSRVVNGRRSLTDAQRKHWARLLSTTTAKIFPPTTQEVTHVR